MLGVAQLINEAWNYESGSDSEVALRIYKTAFNNILDINGQLNSPVTNNLPNISPFEVRSVADYLNQRTCHIQFMLNHPREAITQFKRYIDTFKQHTKASEYAFEHSAWLSQQYLMFADLFHQAVLSGIKASKTQHPGLYFLEGAMQMIERRKNITEYTNDEIRANQMPVTNELLSMITTNNFATFLRNCGWTCIDPDAGPPVAPPKAQTLPQQYEPINYSDIIVSALCKAGEHFGEWSRYRMQNFINVMIADEFSVSDNTQKAIALYSRSISVCRNEHWCLLVDHIKFRLSAIEGSRPSQDDPGGDQDGVDDSKKELM